jgi:hypothetical protein
MAVRRVRTAVALLEHGPGAFARRSGAELGELLVEMQCRNCGRGPSAGMARPGADRSSSLCLANGDGGHLLLGVDDDGTVVGARNRMATTPTDTASLRW